MNPRLARTLRAAGALLALAALAAAQSRVAFARCELAGPMREPELSLRDNSPTRLRGELLAGERVERVLPVVVGAASARGEPRWRWSGDPEHQGRARFLGWSAGADEAWEALPLGLRSRPRPPAEPAHRAPPLALGCVLAGLALASAALARRKARLAALPSLAACALAWWIAGAGRPESAPECRVLDGDAPSGVWLELSAGWERLSIPAGTPGFVLLSRPEEAGLELETELARDGATTIRARGAELWCVRAPAEEPGELSESGQSLGELDQVWWRAEGEWSYRGAWARGAALPAPRPGPPPPGWLANGLPQGPRVCLAHQTAAGGRWIRQLGP